MSIVKDIAGIFERRAFCGGARCRLGGMSVAAAVLLMTFALPLPAAGQDTGEECEFHRFYLGSAGTVVLPHGGGDVRRLGGASFRAGCYLTEFWAVEAEASILENHAGYGARVLWHWWGYERFDPFFTCGVKGITGSGYDDLGPQFGAGAFYHLTERVSLRFDAESVVGMNGDTDADYSLSLGLQFFF